MQKNVLKLDPTNITLRLELCSFLQSMGDGVGAEAELRAILKLDPANTQVRLSLS